ncbi:hypothetical protein [Candidatus Enterovibrio escicola]|uniref:hypothetical protein n=1 Tax=Candidatus Enterovibrio escicola TaxID=1927127 RepID=UPI00167FF962|nr:hypothetical protein [Candidatus Enterovibrio escacola]
MTIIVSSYHSHYRDFKTYYTQFVFRHLTGQFSNFISYTWMLKLMQSALFSL